MANETGTIVDMRLGVYRRQYANFVHGKRINSVSFLAECAFWRFHAAADDYGNFSAVPEALKSEAFPRRKAITPRKAAVLFQELVEAHLIQEYVVDGEAYGHIVGFELRQPAPKNGKRIKRHPAPGDSGCVQIIPVHPEKSCASDSDSDSDSDSPPSPPDGGDENPFSRRRTA